MNLVNELIQLFVDVALIEYYGWVLFLGLLIWMMYFLRKQSNNNKYIASTAWVFLEVKIDELSEKSALAMEQIFAATHAIHTNYTWGEILNGKSILWITCEIVSLGGKVSYIFKIPSRYRNLFESAVFAQYPKAEIYEVEDYLKSIPHHYDPDHAEFDFWGTQWNKKKDSAYPIRTYLQTDSFEHSAMETFIDPLSNLIEVMSNIEPHELMVWQVVAKPEDDKWKEHTKHLVDKLKGVPAHNEEPFWLSALFFIPRIFGDFLISLVSGPADPHAKPERKQEEPPSLMLHRTDVEKMVITAIEHAMSKVSYEVRVRGLYLAPKDKFKKSLRVPEIVGAVRNFDDVNLNGIKPDIAHTWTDKAYKISETLERPYLRTNILKRKRHLLHYFTARSSWKGSGKFYMNTEELATIFHFPIIPHARISQLERVHTVKSAPPMDLPIR